MSKKKGKKQGHPSLALALVAIAAPVVFGQIHNSFAASADTPKGVTKAQHFELFNAAEFRQRFRKLHVDGYSPVGTTPKLKEPAGSSSSSVSSSSSSTSSKRTYMIIEDLTIPQRDQLRRFIRTGVCPQSAEITKLCEKMLREKGKEPAKAGWRNSKQK